MKNRKMSSFDINLNKCEICGRQAQGGIQDYVNSGIIRYTCANHVIELHNKMLAERKKEAENAGLE